MMSIALKVSALTIQSRTIMNQNKKKLFEPEEERIKNKCVAIGLSQSNIRTGFLRQIIRSLL